MQPDKTAGAVNCTVTAITLERCDGETAVFVLPLGDGRRVICGEEKNHRSGEHGQQFLLYNLSKADMVIDLN